MRPDDRALDDEIRGHLALAVTERVAGGEDPAAARLAALRELGYQGAVREEMRRVWYGRWHDALADVAQDVRLGVRSLARAKGLAATVVVTLALGIGANAAIVSVVRGVLLRPLVNRGEDRLVYIRQSAPGIGGDNTTFSVPEVRDLTSRVSSVAAFGDFSTFDFTLLGLGEPRIVQAGIVGGSFFEVMGLRPVLGRLLGPEDDGPDAAGAVVLTHRFWIDGVGADPAVVGRTIRLGTRTARIVGVLEPAVPYPTQTQLFTNLVTSPHHLGATMVTMRTHRMTELFGRLAPGVSIETARADLVAAHAAMMRRNPEAYPAAARMALRVTPFRDEITAPARTILLLLLSAAGVVFAIACSNVANLVLARSVRREGELAVRAALGASTGALRRTLLIESLILCGTGAALGVLLARPLVAVVSGFAARFSVRALEVTVDATLVWVGAGLAIAAAILLAYVPRLPSSQAPGGLALGSGSVRLTVGVSRRLRVFAMTQVALSFVLLSAAGMLVATLLAMQTAKTGLDVRRVLAIDLPTPSGAFTNAAERDLYKGLTRRVGVLPGVSGVALGSFVPWRDAGLFGPGLEVTTDPETRATGTARPHARLRVVDPGFFAVLGVPLLAGRDFSDDDRADAEPVVIVSQSAADRLFPDGSPVGRRLRWTDPYFGRPRPWRIVGVVADVDDEHLVPGPALTVYHPVEQLRVAGRLFVHTTGDPRTLGPEITRVIREALPSQPVARVATLADVRTAMLAPERLSAIVLSGFAGVALVIAVVGVAGVLAFSVSARTREFGVRLAIGSTPRALLLGVLSDGARMVGLGIAAGAASGYAFAALAAPRIGFGWLPGALPAAAAAVLLVTAAIVASLMPAARASRVDVLQALRSE